MNTGFYFSKDFIVGTFLHNLLSAPTLHYTTLFTARSFTPFTASDCVGLLTLYWLVQQVV